MTTTQSFLNHIRLLIGESDLKTALSQLQRFLRDSPQLDEALMQSARFQDVVKHIHSGTVDFGTAAITKNQINKSVLDLLREMEEQGKTASIQAEMKEAVLISEEIYEYQKIKEKIFLNRGAGTSELLKDKQVRDLDEKELENFFKLERVVRSFDDEGLVLSDLTTQQRLVQLSLAENGHLFKGTFLCLGKRNQIQIISHSATESQFMQFRGTERTDFVILETLGGNIMRQYEKMMMLLRVHIPLRRDREKSEDIYEIPMPAIREFIANAFIHRDYDYSVQSYIQVELFDDKLEIKSPGQLPPNFNINKITGTVLINPTVAAVFHLYKYVERTGTGINNAQRLLKEQKLPIATIENIDFPKMVKVTIPRNVYVPNGTKKAIPHFLTQSPFVAEMFIGRENDLAAIKEKLFNGDHLLLLVNGMGGVGKTSLAAKYYDTCQTDYAHTAWVVNEANIARALLSHLTEPLGLTFEPNTTEVERLDILLRGLAELNKPCLLVIDNANEQNDLTLNYPKLRQLRNFHLLLITRLTELNHAAFYTIPNLSELEALKLFKSYYPKLKANETPLFTQIYKAVGGNTLLLELLAKNLFLFNRLKQHYSLADLVVDLQNKGFLALSKTQKVQVDYHAQEGIREEKPENIIAAMYDLSELTRSETALLSVFTVLPAENIRFDMLESLLQDHSNELEQNLLNLAQKGWIEYDEPQTAFRCHTIIQAITRTKNLLLREDCTALIRSLMDKLNNEVIRLDNSTEANLIIHYAQALVEAFPKPDDLVIKTLNELIKQVQEKLSNG